MIRKICLSVPEWFFNQYLEPESNRSAFVVEMVTKGVSVTLNDKARLEKSNIQLLHDLRAKEAEFNKLKHDFELVKARVMTQEKRKQEKSNAKRMKAYNKSMKEIEKQRFTESYLKSVGGKVK